MEWDLIFKFSGFNVNNVRLPKGDDSPFRVHLVAKKDRPMHCHKCGTIMSQQRSYQRCQVEDLKIQDHKVLLVFRRRKAKCPTCKKVRLEQVDFLCNQNPKVTARLAFLLFQFCEVAPISRMAEITKRNKMSLWRNDLALLKNQLSHYEIPPISKLSIDEVYARAHHEEGETRSDRFFTIFTNAKTSRVLWVEESRRKEACDNFFKRIGPVKAALIEVVATDEHDDYIASVKEYCPNAVCVLDRFHLSRHLEKAVNGTRKILVKTLAQKNIKQLVGGNKRYIFMKRASKRTAEEQSHLDKVVKDNKMFFHLELIKERLLSLFDAKDEKEATDIFLEAETWSHECGFPPLKKLCKKLRKKWDSISNYFMCRLTTARSEGINTMIKALKRRSFGFRNMDYFKLKIMQVCGHLSTRYMNLNGSLTAAGKSIIHAGR